MIKCNKCGIEKEQNSFYLRKSGKNAGKLTGKVCRDCYRINASKYRSLNREIINEKSRQKGTRIYKVKEIIKSHKKCTKCSEDKKIEDFYFDSQKKLHTSQCKSCKMKSMRQLPQQRISRKLRTRINSAIRNKSNSTKSLIGCEYELLIKWLKFQFTPYMSFENYGKVWNIDHNIPCNSFNLEKQEEQVKCFNWTNLRPLDRIDNLKKSYKVPKNAQLFNELKSYVFKRRILNYQLC